MFVLNYFITFITFRVKMSNWWKFHWFYPSLNIFCLYFSFESLSLFSTTNYAASSFIFLNHLVLNYFLEVDMLSMLLSCLTNTKNDVYVDALSLDAYAQNIIRIRWLCYNIRNVKTELIITWRAFNNLMISISHVVLFLFLIFTYVAFAIYVAYFLCATLKNAPHEKACQSNLLMMWHCENF